MFQDLRHALRMLWQTKGWTGVVLLSLALGIGINTTLFSAVNALLLKTIAVHNPEELVRIRWVGDNQMATNSSDYGFSERGPAGERVRPTFSYSAFQALELANQTLDGMFACAPLGAVNFVVNGEAELASAFLSSGSYFQVLGVAAFIGRTLTPEDDQPDATAVAMISYGYWERRFGSDSGVIGRDVTINNTRTTIVGVTPPSYTGIQRLGESSREVHLPLSLDRQLTQRDRLDQGTSWWLQIVGRLKPGVRREQVEGNLDGVFQQAARAGWDSYFSTLSSEQRSLSRNQNRTAVPSFDVASAARGVYDPRPDSARSISILGAVVVLVLLIVCANVANLLLSRATVRSKEISIRLSIGATRARLVRQLLTASVLLAVVGGALAMLVAYWSRELLPIGSNAPLDFRVFAFAVAVSVVTGLIFGLIPALRATSIDLAGTMKESSRSIVRSRTLLGKSLLVVQVATSLVLLIGVGLFLRTLDNLRGVEVGFNTQNLLLVPVNPSVNRYDQEQSRRLAEEMKREFQAIPGVLSVGLSRTALLSGSRSTSSIYVQGAEATESDNNNVHVMTVSQEFFETLQIPIVLGRGLTSSDDEGAPRVALINEAAAREFFPGGSPLGHRFGSSPESRGDVEVVGVVADTKYSSIRNEAPPTAYHSFLRRPVGRMIFELRTAVDSRSLIPSVREAAQRIDSNLPLGGISTQSEEVEQLLSQERLFALAYALFGGLALVLACIGLFGLMSYSVARRTNEIGIRMALGAERRRVVRMVLQESLLLVLIGSAIGLTVSLAAGRFIASLLYDLAPTDPLTILGATVVMLLVSGIAVYLPARRAAKVDPMIALHYE